MRPDSERVSTPGAEPSLDRPGKHGRRASKPSSSGLGLPCNGCEYSSARFLCCYASSASFPCLFQREAQEAGIGIRGFLWACGFQCLIATLLGGPLFEDFGWRGFLQSRLQQAMPPWAAAICVGSMWAAWRLPLFLVKWSSASPFLYLLIVISLATLMAYAFNSSGHAVVVAILMHSVFNASQRFLDPFIGVTPTRAHPSGEFFIGLAFLISAAVVVTLTLGNLAPKKP